MPANAIDTVVDKRSIFIYSMVQGENLQVGTT